MNVRRIPVSPSGVRRYRASDAPAGWRGPWRRLIAALRLVGMTLLYAGCLLEILWAVVIAYVIVNGGV